MQFEKLKIEVVYGLEESWWGTQKPPDILDRDDSGSIAGGETYLLETSFGLELAGHDVTVYSTLFKRGKHRGVKFLPFEDYIHARAEGNPVDVVVSHLDPGPLCAAPATAARIFAQQCNDFLFPPEWSNHCDAVVAASSNHAQFLATLGTRGVQCFSGPYEVVHNGCHLERYPSLSDLVPPQKRAPIVAYWSSPDRGLHHLLRAWPFVLRERPDARLRVHYELDRLLNRRFEGYSQGEARVFDLRDAVASVRNMPSVEFTGMLSKSKLIQCQLETRVFAYPLDPTQYTEGFGGSVAEAAAAGVLPLIRGVDAFPSVYGRIELDRFETETRLDTVASTPVRWIEGNPFSPEFPRQLAEQVVRGLAWSGELSDDGATRCAATHACSVIGHPSRASLRALANRWQWKNTHAEINRVVQRVIARKSGGVIPPPAFPLETP